MDNGNLSGQVSLVDRVKAIILRPKEEWPVIAAESTTQGDILRSYVLPLAAIGPVADFIGSQIFGRSFLFITHRPSLLSSLSTAVMTFILSIVGLFILAWIADWLAPKFDGKSNKLNAFKLVAYGATAAWLAQIFSLIPALSFFAILGLYSIYLFFTGITPLMAIPDDKRIAYTVVTFLCAFVLNLLVSIVASSLIGLFGLSGPGSAIAGMSDDDNVTVSIPGVGTVDTGKMKEAAKRMEKVQKGEIKAVPTETLKAMLPDRIGSFTRTGYSGTKMGNAGAGVEGNYESGDQHFDLHVNDMLALSGLAGIGSAMGIEHESEDASGYERTGTVDGQWRTEKWNKTSNSGTYGILVANRFQVEASGQVDDIGVLKDAVAAVDEGDLEDLAE